MGHSLPGPWWKAVGWGLCTVCCWVFVNIWLSLSFIRYRPVGNSAAGREWYRTSIPQNYLEFLCMDLTCSKRFLSTGEVKSLQFFGSLRKSQLSSKRPYNVKILAMIWSQKELCYYSVVFYAKSCWYSWSYALNEYRLFKSPAYLLGNLYDRKRQEVWLFSLVRTEVKFFSEKLLTLTDLSLIICKWDSNKAYFMSLSEDLIRFSM